MVKATWIWVAVIIVIVIIGVLFFTRHSASQQPVGSYRLAPTNPASVSTGSAGEMQQGSDSASDPNMY